MTTSKPKSKPVAKRGTPAAKRGAPAAKRGATKRRTKAARARLFGDDPDRTSVEVELPAYLHTGGTIELVLATASTVPVAVTAIELRWSWLEIDERGVRGVPQLLQTETVRASTVAGAPARISVPIASWRAITDAEIGNHARSASATLDRELDEPLTGGVHPPQIMLAVCARVDGVLGLVGKQLVKILPPLAGPLVATGRLSSDDLRERLEALGATHALMIQDDERWFVWFPDRKGNCVGEAELAAVVSMRDSGIGRTLTNAALPRFAMLALLPDEPRDEIRQGTVADARAWARDLVERAPMLDVLFPWMLANTFFALRELRLALRG